VDYVGKMLWVVFGAHLAGLIAAVLAGLFAVRRLQRRPEEAPGMPGRTVVLEESPAPA
jgi:membrane associated rhomboid family serine protease